jgi:hypothetical protein
LDWYAEVFDEIFDLLLNVSMEMPAGIGRFAGVKACIDCHVYPVAFSE